MSMWVIQLDLKKKKPMCTLTSALYHTKTGKALKKMDRWMNELIEDHYFIITTQMQDFLKGVGSQGISQKGG